MPGRFFQIDALAWERVIECGLNASVAYLVLACGTGRDNRTTVWSVNAIEKYTGIGRHRAKLAIQKLIDAGLVSRLQGTRQVYYIAPGTDGQSIELEVPTANPEPRWIWLPNSLVTGVSGEPSPIERVRGLQKVRVLQHLVALYDVQDLAQDGGIHWRSIRLSYERSQITERGIWNIWGFVKSENLTTWRNSPVAAPFKDASCCDGEADQFMEQFWESWHALRRLGLIECVPHLVEADNDEAEIVFPCPGEDDDGTPEERDLGRIARDRAEQLLGEPMCNRVDAYDVVVPVPNNFPEVEMVGIFRLRYRPHTRRTAAWFAKTQNSNWRKRLDELSVE